MAAIVLGFCNTVLWTMLAVYMIVLSEPGSLITAIPVLARMMVVVFSALAAFFQAAFICCIALKVFTNCLVRATQILFLTFWLMIGAILWSCGGIGVARGFGAEIPGAFTDYGER